MMIPLAGYLFTRQLFSENRFCVSQPRYGFFSPVFMSTCDFN